MVRDVGPGQPIPKTLAGRPQLCAIEGDLLEGKIGQARRQVSVETGVPRHEQRPQFPGCAKIGERTVKTVVGEIQPPQGLRVAEFVGNPSGQGVVMRRQFA